MEKDQEQKHACKFCNKSFHCGRSLGGHMRSHLMTISSSSDHPKNDENAPKKKLPPLSNPKTEKKTSKPTKAHNKEDSNLILEKSCKECGKAFQSWKALFGHMKCHSVNGNAKTTTTTNCLDEDSWIMDSQSDSEAATSCRKKRSDRMVKRYTATTPSSSLTIANSEMDQHEQEEVAMSLIILSRDKTEWGGFVDSSDNSPQKIRSVKQLEVNALKDEDGTEFEVNSPKIKRSDHDQFERKKSCSKKRKAQIPSSHDLISKFRCSICKKDFQSYQALGGHRASHKKFKGCCAPRSEDNSLETENSHNQSENQIAEKAEIGCKKSKDHECPICFKIFSSGQALGGHKRSHLIMDQANQAMPPKQTTEKIRGFLDLNLPAPAEEECNEFKPWWIGAGPLLGLLSS